MCSAEEVAPVQMKALQVNVQLEKVATFSENVFSQKKKKGQKQDFQLSLSYSSDICSHSQIGLHSD